LQLGRDLRENSADAAALGRPATGPCKLTTVARQHLMFAPLTAAGANAPEPCGPSLYRAIVG
jgi:hypothetical protein